jgi:hypothetical protein
MHAEAVFAALGQIRALAIEARNQAGAVVDWATQPYPRPACPEGTQRHWEPILAATRAAQAIDDLSRLLEGLLAPPQVPLHSATQEVSTTNA